MSYRLITAILIIGIIASSCDLNLNTPDDGNGGTNPDSTIYQNTSSNLPTSLGGSSEKVKAADIDNDGDMDLIIASELEANKILINNGSGVFSENSTSRIPAQAYDSQDLTVADFNGDVNLDLFFVNNQSQTNELYMNNGSGIFSDLSNRIPVTGNSTSAEALDVNSDGSADILIGNIGQNVMLINNGNAIFSDQTTQRLPQIADQSRDIAVGDITGDNARDIIVGNIGTNQALINNGTGFFTNQTGSRIPFNQALEETQDVDMGDVDNDGDLDLYFGNTGLGNGGNPQDRLLINDGSGFYSDETADRLPNITTDTFDAEFADLEGDGDIDLVVGNYNGGLRVLINNGSGFYTDKSDVWIPKNFTPSVADIEITNFNNDLLLDIYIGVHNGQDRLLLFKND